MRKFVALGVVVALLGALDQGARLFAENKLEEKARSEARGASSVDARISSFPFLGRLLLSASVPKVEVRAERSQLSDLLTATVEVDLLGVRLERDALFSGRVRLRDIDAGAITVELDAAALAQAVKVPVTIAGDEVRVTVAGRSVSARLAVEAGALVLNAAGLRAFRVPVTRNGLVNCTAAAVEVAGSTVRLSCDVDEVPPALRR